MKQVLVLVFPKKVLAVLPVLAPKIFLFIPYHLCPRQVNFYMTNYIPEPLLDGSSSFLDYPFAGAFDRKPDILTWFSGL